MIQLIFGIAIIGLFVTATPLAMYFLDERQDRLRGERWARDNPNGGGLNVRLLDEITRLEVADGNGFEHLW